MYAAGASVLSGGRFEYNSSNNGGGLYAASTLVLTGTQFISNTATNAGGGGYAAGAAVLSDGRFEHNASSLNNGGGLATASTLTLANPQFINNTAQSYGGGAYASGAVTLNGGLFQNNRTYQFAGGGLATQDTLTLTGTQFIGNAAAYEGGGAYVAGAATLNDGLFRDNRTLSGDHSGGGLYTGDTLALTGTQFLSNTSIWNGGGAFAVGAATLSGGRFENNSANRAGGGLYANNTLALTNMQFINNTAVISGGGLMLESGNGQLANTLFARNTAGSAGAAMYLFDPTGAGGNARLIHATIANPTVGTGSAIYVGQGTVGLTNTIIANYAAGLEVAGGAAATSDYNLFFNAPGSIVAGSHSITGADPLFFNPADNDYHLMAGSPAIDAGTDAGVTTDLEGQLRDAVPNIGAYETASGAPVKLVYLPLLMKNHN
jgi:predicted outer membrane repeat protein